MNLMNLRINLGQLGWVAPPAPPPTAPSYDQPSAPPIPLEGFGDLPPPTYEQAITADEGMSFKCGVQYSNLEINLHNILNLKFLNLFLQL